MGRPSKLTEKFLKITKEVLNDDISTIIFTDEELLEEINDRLEENERITDKTFQNWKQDKSSEFFLLVKKAKRIQKKNLLNELKTTPNNWQRFAWILERKFTEFNLKQLSEVKHDIPEITINIKLDK